MSKKKPELNHTCLGFRWRWHRRTDEKTLFDRRPNLQCGGLWEDPGGGQGVWLASPLRPASAGPDQPVQPGHQAPQNVPQLQLNVLISHRRDWTLAGHLTQFFSPRFLRVLEPGPKRQWWILFTKGRARTDHRNCINDLLDSCSSLTWTEVEHRTPLRPAKVDRAMMATWSNSSARMCGTWNGPLTTLTSLPWWRRQGCTFLGGLENESNFSHLRFSKLILFLGIFLGEMS